MMYQPKCYNCGITGDTLIRDKNIDELICLGCSKKNDKVWIEIRGIIRDDVITSNSIYDLTVLRTNAKAGGVGALAKATMDDMLIACKKMNWAVERIEVESPMEGNSFKTMLILMSVEKLSLQKCVCKAVSGDIDSIGSGVLCDVVGCKAEKINAKILWCL